MFFLQKISITLKIHFTLYFAHLESVDPYLTKPTVTYSNKFKVKCVFIYYYKSTKKTDSMLRVLPANAALRNWKIGHIFFENKILEAENEVQKIVVPIQLLHVKVEGLRTQIDQGKC